MPTPLAESQENSFAPQMIFLGLRPEGWANHGDLCPFLHFSDQLKTPPNMWQLVNLFFEHYWHLRQITSPQLLRPLNKEWNRTKFSILTMFFVDCLTKKTCLFWWDRIVAALLGPAEQLWSTDNQEDGWREGGEGQTWGTSQHRLGRHSFGRVFSPQWVGD